jgi:O-antigen/teichoic acid export membrane protein
LTISTLRDIAKNLLVLNLSAVLSNVLGFALSVVLARQLGVSGFGQLSFAITFTSLFMVPTDMGLSSIATRNIARNKDTAARYFGNILILKTGLCLVTYAAMLAAITVLGYPPEVKCLVLLLGGYVIFQSFGSFFNAISNAFEKMEIEAALSTAMRMCLLAGAAWVLYHEGGAVGVAAVHAASGFVCAAGGFLVVERVLAKPRLELNWDFSKQNIREGFSFAISSVFLILSTQIDVVMLSMLKGDAAVGLYVAALRIVSALLFIPANFAKTLFPIFSRLWKTSDEQFVIYYRKSFQLLLLIAIPIGIGGMLLSHRVVSMVFGPAYESSAVILQVLVWSLAIQFVTTLLGIVMSAIERQATATWIFFGGMLFNIAMNFLLIPAFEGVGAAVATLMTNLFYFVTFFRVLSKHVGAIRLLQVSIKPLLCGSLLAAGLLAMNHVHLITLMVFGALLYGLSLLGLGVLDAEDWRLLRKTFSEFRVLRK